MQLTPNQALLIRGVGQAERPPSVGEIAEWPNSDGQPFGENAARSAMSRLAERGYVTGFGAGRARSFTLTPDGVELAIEMRAAANGTRDSDPNRHIRPYVVLEEVDTDRIEPADLDDLLNRHQVYVRVADVDARNTEHALKLGADVAYPEAERDTVLVPVALRMFQPEPVEIRNSRRVKIG